MAMPDDLLIVATLMKKMPYEDLRTMATLLVEAAEDDDDFNWEDIGMVAQLLNDFATNQIEADD